MNKAEWTIVIICLAPTIWIRQIVWVEASAKSMRITSKVNSKIFVNKILTEAINSRITPLCQSSKKKSATMITMIKNETHSLLIVQRATKILDIQPIKIRGRIVLKVVEVLTSTINLILHRLRVSLRIMQEWMVIMVLVKDEAEEHVQPQALPHLCSQLCKKSDLSRKTTLTLTRQL